MSRFLFWQRFLFFSSLLIALLAACYAVFPGLPLFNPYNRAINMLLWHTPVIPPEAGKFRNFIYGPLGGTLACAYLLLAYIACYPFKQKEPWVRYAILVSFGAWLLLDSLACLRYGIFFQLYIINGVSLLQKLLPLVFTWREFDRKKVRADN